MAVQMDSGGNDVKTQFITREGTYRLMTLSEYSRPNRVGYTNNQGSSQVRVSFVTLPDPTGNGDRICFNYGKELYVYVYKGVKKAADLTKPVDKKMYKGTNPTCHDFNSASVTSDSVSLLIGFSTGQIQLIDPIKKELSKLFNEERLIDKTKVTCIHWVPGSSNLFLVSHASGQLYVYNEELMCGTTPPNYQPFKQGEGYAIHTCKTKSTRNPLYRWVIGNEGCCINEFAFSPCGTNLAVVSQDGFLRVFHYDTMELIGLARSYFGGFLCVCWSPDGRYIVVGGEDDLVTVWSLHERRVVARGQGHRSWVSVVAFDPYTTSYNDPECHEFSGSDDESQQTTNNRKYNLSSSSNDYNNSANNSSSGGGSAACYRLGSVSQDTQLCLWDITEDVLNQPMCNKNRTSNCCTIMQPRTNNTSLDTIDNATTTMMLMSSTPSTIQTTTTASTIMASSNQLKHRHHTILNNSSNNSGLSGSNISGGGGSSVLVNNSIITNATSTTPSTLTSNINSNILYPNETTTTTLTGTGLTTTATLTTGVTTTSASSMSSTVSSTVNSLTQRLTLNLSFGSDKKSTSTSLSSTAPAPTENAVVHKRNFSLGSKSASTHNHQDHGKSSFGNMASMVTLRNKNNGAAGTGGHMNNSNSSGGNNCTVNGAGNGNGHDLCDPLKLIGTASCPRFDECPVLEPLVCKKIAHERLTALVFREDCLVTACQDGYVYTWARPGKMNCNGDVYSRSEPD